MPLFGLGKPNVEKLKAKKDVYELTKALLYTDDVEVRLAAAAALGELGGSEAVTALLHEVKEKSPLRVASIKALGRIGDDRAVPLLIFCLNSDDLNASNAAEDALVQIGVPAVPDLIKLLDDVTGKAAKPMEILVRIGKPAKLALFSALYVQSGIPRKYIADIICSIGPDVDDISYLTKTLAYTVKPTGDSDVAAVGRLIFSKIGKPAVPELVRALRDPELFVRANAALALGTMGGVAIDAVPHLIASLNDHPYVVRYASQALEKIGADPTTIVLQLMQSLRKEDPATRGNAAIALGGFGEKASQAIPLLVEALVDPKSSIATEAAEALSKMGQAAKDAAVKPLLAVWQRQPSLSGPTLDALIKLGATEMVEPILNDLYQSPRTFDKVPFRQVLQDLLAPYSVPPEIVDWAVDASTYENHPNDRRETYSIVSDEAIACLCELNTPITTNILYHVVKKNDLANIRIESYWEYNDWYESVSFSRHRSLAVEELKKRGDPPYRADAYFNSQNEKLKTRITACWHMYRYLQNVIKELGSELGEEKWRRYKQIALNCRTADALGYLSYELAYYGIRGTRFRDFTSILIGMAQNVRLGEQEIRCQLQHGCAQSKDWNMLVEAVIAGIRRGQGI